MESSSLFNPGFLGGSFYWFIGQVADDSTWRENQNPDKFEEISEMPAWGYRYKVIEETAEQVDVTLAGKGLPKFNTKFDTEKKDFTRTTFYLIDSGTMPIGSTKDQIEASTSDNFQVYKTLNQSIRRYNQLFSGMMEITIAGDFSLHAGDVIFVDIFSVQAEKDDTLNRESGGLYIIADLCHFLDADATYTKLNLARDSFGRDGNHSKR